MNDDVLTHYGVLGMRWGRRTTKRGGSAGSRPSSIKERWKTHSKMVEEANKEFKEKILTDKKFRRGIYLRDAGKSAVAGGLLTFGINKAFGVSTVSAATSAARAAAVSAALSTVLNGLTVGILKEQKKWS